MTEQEFLDIWHNQVLPRPVELEYRLYYDENGLPLFYSTEKADGNFVIITKDMFLHSPTHVKVVAGKIVVSKTSFAKKLVPAEHGQACAPSNVCIVVDPAQAHTKWNLKYEESTHDQAS